MHKKTKALLQSAVSLLLCFSMLIGSTFAWFTDSVTSSGNIITTGKLDLEMYWTDKLDGSNTTWKNVEDAADNTIFNHSNWEPGYTQVRYIKLVNAGNLALKYQLAIEPVGAVGDLADAIRVYSADNGTVVDDYADLASLSSHGVLRDVLNHGVGATVPEGNLQPNGEVIVTLAMSMDTAAGNEYQSKDAGAFTVKALATQYASESDSFGADYDSGAQYDYGSSSSGGGISTTTASVSVVPTDDDKVPTGGAAINGTGASAAVPEGVQLNAGTNKLTLSIAPMANSAADVDVDENEVLIPVDVHIEGVAEDNTVPIIISIKEALPVGLNMGNFRLVHVEDGVTNTMTSVTSLDAVVNHNDFYYDPATGDVTIAMATFSEVALVADMENAWEGNFDYSWYTNAVALADGEAVTDYIIANADQLAAFGAIVGGMNGQTPDSFSDKTVKLIADVNLGDNESKNNSNLIFYPIGYYNSEGTYERTNTAITSGLRNFEGTFDGQGHTIANFYQNTWEMKGDHDWYTPQEQYYRDGMGLFGKVYGGTVKNLTVSNFSSDGEIATTGVIAAYAAGDATFENIAITNCNPRVYNTGNGGIIGIAGDTRSVDDDHITLKNITVDNSNKISALWGSWDVACSGLVGMYRGNVDGRGNATGDTISFENCHVAAQIDVYNDVCANYQYYAYRYAGMIIGSVRHNTTNTDGKTIPNMTGISATGCTVNYGDWNDYYYCEFEKNTMASYSEDYQFSRVPHSDLNFTDSNGNGVVDANERASVTGCKHTHTAEENHQAIYLPFHQLFTGYSWGVSSIGLEKYSGIVTNLGITEGDQEASVEKFETKFTGDFLYRVGNQNTVSLGSLFKAKDGVTISNSGVVATIEAVDKNSNVSGEFTANTTDWTKGTIQFSGTGVVKVTIQDYNFCTPTTLTLEVVDATNLTSATGTTTGGNFVLLCDVNTSTYVNYWNCTLYGNGFTYSLNGAPTAYNSKQGHGILITKNATLDNLVIVGDVYNSYGAYTTQDYYNAAVDVVGDTIIQNCYISGCAAPVSARANVTITNTTLYGGTVANLIIKSGTVTLEDVTTANYDDGRSLVGMGIVIHSDATESAKLVLNGTLTQYNFISESKVPTDTYAKNLHNAMFSSDCSQYQFGTSPRYVNTGIISLTSVFDEGDLKDNANTGYVGKSLEVSSYDGYVYTQPNTSGSVNNGYDKENDPHVATTQGAVAPDYSFDYTNKNYVAKTDGSNDYCYEEDGKVNISMDAGDTFNWDTSILTAIKAGQTLSYTVSMDGTDYTGKSIAFNTTGDYTVTYTYTDPNNFGVDENGNITPYSKTYTKTVNISVAVIEAATKHAEFTFGSSNTASTTVTVGNNTYVMPNVSATSSTIGSTTVSGQTIYYPIVEIVMSDKKTSHTSAWYAYFPVFSGAVTITDYKDNGLGDKEAFGSSTQSMPSGLSIVGDPAQLFKYQSSSTAGTSPVVKNNILVYSSPSISAKRSEYNTVIQYSYQDNAGATYYYYIGYHAPAQSYSSCVTPDTLITLATGTQVRVDSLTGNEELLVWNLETGKLDKAPIMFVDSDPIAKSEIIRLSFSDGTEVKVISEHGFWDYDLNRYVYLDRNAADYIGHTFAKQNGNALKKVELVDVTLDTWYSTAWSPVTADHLCYFVNGMLSMPGGVGGLFNIFDVDAKTMTYDFEAMAKDIETYGLFTYEEMNAIAPLSEEMFYAAGGPYLKISIAKGNLTVDELIYMIQRYSKYI